MTSPHTPGLGGYARGILVSGLAVLVASAVLLGPFAVYVAVVLVVFGLPIGVVAAALTHLTCRSVPSQRAHVFFAGLWGYALTLLVTILGGGDLGYVLALPTCAGIAGAIGRAAVISLVPNRRAQEAPR